VSGSCFIGNIRNVTTARADAIPVLIDSFGQLGTASSSRRFKKEIKPMDSASEAILALKPVTFHYKSEAKGTAQFGLIVEDVAEVNPDLVVREEKGEIYTARYDAVNAMLLNEFLKEHRKVEEQGAIIAKQQKQIEALTALNGPPEIAQAPMEMTYFVQGVPAEPEGRQLLARSSTGEAPERANQRQVTEVLQSLT
jgi:Chaperone of endosialidase